MIPSTRSTGISISRPGFILPRWCSSSRNRPDATRASYSAMGPCVSTHCSWPAAATISTRPYCSLGHVHQQNRTEQNILSYAACASPRWSHAPRQSRMHPGLTPGRVSIHTFLTAAIQAVQPNAVVGSTAAQPRPRPRSRAAVHVGLEPVWRDRARSPCSASDDVMFDV